MAELEVAFRLPVDGWPRAVFETDYAYTSGRLVVDDHATVRVQTRRQLEDGVRGSLPGSGVSVAVRLESGQGTPQLHVWVDGHPALREDGLRARPTRSAWIHACLALAASAAGFTASYLYLMKAHALQNDWALKMANHMAGWHLLLTFTLFPASVWGQRVGIRAVQWVSLLFFFIHAGIAAANLGPSDAGTADDAWIATWNAASGVCFLVAAVYGNRAYRDMDPVAALRLGRIRPASLRKEIEPQRTQSAQRTD
jgi:hypothetical protein